MMGGWGFGGGGHHNPQRFEECYHCYSVAYADKAHLEVSLLFFYLFVLVGQVIATGIRQ